MARGDGRARSITGRPRPYPPPTRSAAPLRCCGRGPGGRPLIGPTTVRTTRPTAQTPPIRGGPFRGARLAQPVYTRSSATSSFATAVVVSPPPCIPRCLPIAVLRRFARAIVVRRRFCAFYPRAFASLVVRPANFLSSSHSPDSFSTFSARVFTSLVLVR